MKQYKIFSPTTIICTNCSAHGHQSKQCPQPITSYGVIVFRVNTSWNQTEALLQGATTGLEAVKSNIEYLMIQRRDSIGFVEIMRGKYRILEKDYIKQHLAGMTGEEREKLLTKPFDELWEELWGPPKEGTHAYKNEKEQARQKLEALRPSLADLIDESGSPWDTPEWGFPKGRRELGESEYACAMREMWEETNILERDIVPIRNMEPLTETFYGTNNVKYCHKYYMAYAPPGIGEEGLETAAIVNSFIKREVGRIQWLPYEKAVSIIRPANTEKREVLLRANKLLQTYCPLALFSSDAKKSS